MIGRRPDRRAFLAGSLAASGASTFARALMAAADEPPTPRFDRWRSQMVEHGRKHAVALANPKGPFQQILDSTFYDAQRVFFQIADLTGERSWLLAADMAMAIYRDRYVLAKGGKVSGYWIFPHGMAMHYRRTKDEKSRAAVVALARHAAFASDETPEAETRDVAASREVAYSIHAHLKAEEVGEPRRPRLQLLLDHALGHIDQWFVSRTAPYLQPFMFGLTAEALVAYHAKIGDRRIPEAIRIGADWLWKNTWIAKARAFQYVDRKVAGVGGPDPAADVNLLIAPAYAWLYRRTGAAHYRERGDAIFAGGVDQAWLGSGKQFNQNYRWSFDYVRWRRGGGRSPAPVPAPGRQAGSHG